MKRQQLTIGVLILACIFWNSWILGWLNHGTAGYVHMSISELNVVNQPYYQLFTVLDYLSGVALIAAAVCLVMSGPKKFLFTSLCLLVGAIGLLSIYDSATPLDCNQYHNQVCFVKDVSDVFSVTAQHHNAESIITDYATGLLSFLLIVWLYIKKESKYSLAAAVSLFVVIVVSLEILAYSNHYFADAILERVWNVAVSIVFLLVWYSIYNKKALGSKQGKVSTKT